VGSNHDKYLEETNKADFPLGTEPQVLKERKKQTKEKLKQAKKAAEMDRYALHYVSEKKTKQNKKEDEDPDKKLTRVYLDDPIFEVTTTCVFRKCM
jgi:hypothetical protein